MVSSDVKDKHFEGYRVDLGKQPAWGLKEAKRNRKGKTVKLCSPGVSISLFWYSRSPLSGDVGSSGLRSST